eukprot:scaffold1162_cov372-Prasinococcus_capsulatus_cf.AAC.5
MEGRRDEDTHTHTSASPPASSSPSPAPAPAPPPAAPAAAVAAASGGGCSWGWSRWDRRCVRPWPSDGRGAGVGACDSGSRAASAAAVRSRTARPGLQPQRSSRTGKALVPASVQECASAPVV